MNCTNVASFRDKFHHLRIVIITTIVVVSLKPVLSVNSQFNACQPQKCGENVSVEYPFWISSHQPSSCGNPSLEINCADGKPTIWFSGDTYVILNISYENQSLLLADADAFDDKACVAPRNNVTLSQDMSLSPYDFHLYFFYDCTVFPTHYPTFPIPCLAPKRNSHNFAALLHGSTLKFLNASSEKCESFVAAPVHIDEGVDPGTLDGMNYTNILQKGFLLSWSNRSSSCNECRQSGGRCGQTENQFMCFCHDHNHSRSCDHRRNNGLKIGIASSIVGAFIVAMCVLYCSRRILSKKYWLRRRSENPPNVEEFLRNYWSLSPKRYKYSDVRKMTNSFKEKLGQGGYGSVFKGQLLDGRVVAVKVLDKSNKGNGEEFVNEIVSISRTSHVNIVALLGFCIEGPKRALIYEFMPNGSLEKFIYIDKLSKTGLQDHQQLGWDTLFKIAVGIAQGLEYLHRGCYTRIVHFDIKPHNILLDHDFNPKISDFGMSKLCLKKESTMSTIGARGTIGYIAPEVVLRTFGKVSHKSDVYSYGMMVLEMVGQRRNVDAGVDNTSEIYFPHWIYKRLDQFEQLGLCGATTAGEKELSRKMTIVALWCIQVDSLHRPSMNKVLDMLEGRIEDLDIPPMPTFSSSVSPVHQEICSTISVL